MAVLLGLDLGTTSFKVSAYRDTGEHLATASRPTPWHSNAGGSELRPAEFEQSVLELVEHASTGLSERGEVVALGVTGMAEVMFVETDDGVTHPARAWNSQREHVPLPPRDLLAKTGLIDVGRSSAVELRARADAGQHVRSWTGLPERAVSLLGGARVAERSLAARSGLVDVVAGDWSAELLEWAGVAGNDVPAVSPAGSPSGDVSIGGASGAVLTVAGHDHVVAALGADAADDSAIFDSLGTGEAILGRISSDPIDTATVSRLTSAGFNVGLGLDVHDVIALAGLGTGNRLQLVLAALAQNGFERADVLHPDGRPQPDAETLADDLPGDLPGLVAELGGARWQQLRQTGWSIVARDVSDSAIARALWWAVVARTAANARDAMNELSGLSSNFTRRVAAGGWFADDGIRRVRASVTGEVEISPVRESGTRGAALLGGLAAGVYRSRSDLPTITSIGAMS